MGFESFLKAIGKRATASGTIIDANTKASLGGTSAIFPSDLFTPANEAFILFVKRDPVNQNEISKDTDKDSPARMALYMPPQMKVNYGSQWEEIQMTVFQYMDMGKEGAAGAEFVKNVAGGTDAGRKAAMDAAIQAVGRGFTNLLDFTASGSNFGQQFEQLTKKTLNPHMALLFKGVSFREFSFDFQMMARNEEETEAIRKIIRSFKAGMHPKIEDGSGRYMIYPDTFDIYLKTGVKGTNTDSEYLFQIKTAALTGMSVDYAGSGIPSFFAANGAPVDIRLSLSFKELGVLTREDVHKGY